MSATYLGWQFVTRRIPVAIVVPRKAFALGRDLAQFVQIKNPSDRPLIVTFLDNEAQNELRVMMDSSIRSAVVAAMGRSAETIIDAGERVEFRLAKRADHDEIDPENHLLVRFRWRYAQPFLWRAERTARIVIRKRDYDALVASPADEA